LAEIKIERDLLKKSGSVLCQGNKVTPGEVRDGEIAGDYPVPMMCRIYEISFPVILLKLSKKKPLSSPKTLGSIINRSLIAVGIAIIKKPVP
jgi:hypothetical protein